MPYSREMTGNEGRKRNDMQQRPLSCVMASSLSDLLLLCNQHRMLTDGVFGISEGCKCLIFGCNIKPSETHHWSGIWQPFPRWLGSAASCFSGTGGYKCWGPEVLCSARHIHMASSAVHPGSSWLGPECHLHKNTDSMRPNI